MSLPELPQRAEPDQASGGLVGALIGLALAAVLLTAVLGTSAAVVPLPRGRFPLSLARQPSPWLVSALLALAVGAGAAGTALAWARLRAGWAPSPRRLLAAGLVAVGLLALVPPVGGADVMSYAAYGHIAAKGLDPWTVHPDALAGDPFTQSVEDPWRATPSVYGPLAVAEQHFVVSLAGGRLRLAVGLLDLVNALAFALAGWLLYLLAGPDDARRRRVVLAFSLNPVLILVVVAEAHIDALVVLLVVGALFVLRRSPWLAGALGGLGGLVKLTAGLPLAGWVWLLRWGRTRAAARPRSDWAQVGLFAGAAGAVVAAGYATVGLHALTQARRASTFVSVGTPWRPLRAAVQAVAGHHAAQQVVSAGAVALTLWLATRLAQTLPGAEADAEREAHGGAEGGGAAASAAALAAREVVSAARAGLVLALAWTLAAPYVLAWYDAVPWALLALLPVSRFHRILLAHTAVLALAYLPGRVVPLPHLLNGLATGLRSGLTPAVLAALLIAAFLRPRPATVTIKPAAEAPR